MAISSNDSNGFSEHNEFLEGTNDHEEKKESVSAAVTGMSMISEEATETTADEESLLAEQLRAEQIATPTYTTPDGHDVVNIQTRLANNESATQGVLKTGVWSNGPGSALSSEISDDGARWWLSGTTLYIDCEPGRVISWNDNFSSSTWGAYTSYPGAWGPVRGVITAVEMTKNVQADSMRAWFSQITTLTDASGVFVPEGCSSVYGLFYGCRSLRTVGDSFKMPTSLVNAIHLFAHCAMMESYPDDFTFANCPNFRYAESVFFENISLIKLPDGFRLPEGTTDCDYTFEGAAIETLPEGFNLPSTATEMNGTFRACSNLTSLPASLTLTQFKDSAQVRGLFNDGPPFRSDVRPNSYWNVFDRYDGLVTRGGATVEELERLLPQNAMLNPATLPQGSAATPAKSAQEYWESWYGRTLQSSKAVSAQVTFTTTDGNGYDLPVPGYPLQKTSGRNAMVQQPEDPILVGYALMGWYCGNTTVLYDFDRPLDAQRRTDGQLLSNWATADGTYVIRAKMVGPIYSCEMPITTQNADFVIDMIDPDKLSENEVELQFRSNIDYGPEITPAITGVWCTSDVGASQLFKTSDDIKKAELLLTLGDLVKKPLNMYWSSSDITLAVLPENGDWLKGKLRVRLNDAALADGVWSGLSVDRVVQIMWVVSLIS